MQKEIIGGHTLYCGDCYEIMLEFRDGSFDLLLTDPPYEFISKNPRGGGFYKSENRKHLQEIKNTFGFSFAPEKFLLEANRLLKSFNAYIFTNKNLLKNYIAFSSDRDYHWDLLLWEKNNPVPVYNGHYMCDKEFLFFIKKRGAFFNTKQPYYTYTSFFESKIGGNGYHPTEKPLALCTKALTVSSKEGDMVLDPFMGSGTTGVACEQTRRVFVGIEKEQKYFDIACRRIEAEYNQQQFNF